MTQPGILGNPARPIADDRHVHPFRVDLPEEAIIDERRRVAASRWLRRQQFVPLVT
jgi:hypothetical protein